MMLRAAIAQTDIACRDIDRNKHNVTRFFEEASQKDVELIVFPEMTFTGFSLDARSASSYSEELLEFMSLCSKKYKINSIFGYAALCEDDSIRNMCAAISNDGEIISKYAKIHVMAFSEQEQEYANGNDTVTFSVNGVRISMLICFDLRFPEIFQAVSNESDIITVIANWPSKRLPHWNIMLPTRALENQCYVIGVNRVGRAGDIDYSGGSAIISPCGEALCGKTDKEALIVHDIDIKKVADFREKFPLKKSRRNSFYRNFY